MSYSWKIGALNRRRLLTGIAGGAGMIAAPSIWTSASRAANKELLVRTPGGAFDDVKRVAVYEPFRELTGITIVPVPATGAKLLAMHKSGQMELDLIDTGDDVLLQLDAEGALAEIDYGKFTHTNPDDIDSSVRRAKSVGSYNYAMVMTYNTEKHPEGAAPRSWADFWDVQKFPGPRTMADMATGSPDLEFALLADGVQAKDLYPLDIDRAFASLGRIKAHITKFWDTGALSAQMLADREVLLGSIWSTRAFVAIDNGAPLAIEWNQNAVLGQAYGIPVGTGKKEAALAFIDYTASPEVQKRWLAAYKGVPINKQAYSSASPSLFDSKTGLPYTVSQGFVRDIQWWSENRAAVNRKWSTWIAE